MEKKLDQLIKDNKEIKADNKDIKSKVERIADIATRVAAAEEKLGKVKDLAETVENAQIRHDELFTEMETAEAQKKLRLSELEDKVKEVENLKTGVSKEEVREMVKEVIKKVVSEELKGLKKVVKEEVKVDDKKKNLVMLKMPEIQNENLYDDLTDVLATSGNNFYHDFVSITRMGKFRGLHGKNQKMCRFLISGR